MWGIIDKWSISIQQLLEGVEVEWKTLGDIVKIKHGKDYKHLGKGEYPVYWSWWIMTYVDAYSYNKPTVLLPRKGTITNVFYVEDPFWNVDTIYYTVIQEEIINVKYFFYFMKNYDLKKLDSGSGRPSLTMEILNKVQIPIPPLPIQNEIVRILDKFTELEARKSQYEYYRNKLLTFEREIKRKCLGEIGEFVRGNWLQKKDFVEEGIGCIHYGQIYTYYRNSATKTKSFVTPELAEKLKKVTKGGFDYYKYEWKCRRCL